MLRSGFADDIYLRNIHFDVPQPLNLQTVNERMHSIGDNQKTMFILQIKKTSLNDIKLNKKKYKTLKHTDHKQIFLTIKHKKIWKITHQITLQDTISTRQRSLPGTTRNTKMGDTSKFNNLIVCRMHLKKRYNAVSLSPMVSNTKRLFRASCWAQLLIRTQSY